MLISKETLDYAGSKFFKLVKSQDEKSIKIIRRTHRKTWTIKLESNVQGLFFQKTNLPSSIKIELPYWVENENHLKEMIDFLNAEIKAI